MLELLKNEMKTLNDRVKKPGPEWARQCAQRGDSSILDFMVVENGSKETEVHICAADVGNESLPNTDNQQTRIFTIARGRELYRWRVDKVL